MPISDSARVALTSHRTTTWRVWLCDDHDQLLRPLDEFVSGRVECNRFQRIRGGGSLELSSDAAFAGIDWGRARFRVEQDIAGLDDPIPWGVYLAEKPETVWEDEQGTSHCTVSLMDKLLVPDQDSPTDTYSLAAGTNIVSAVVGILTSLGELRFAATPSTLTLPTARSWPVSEAEVTWLTIINDLLSIAGFYSLWCDGDGVYQVGPYRPSGISDEPAWTFTYGATPSSLYMPEWTESEDWFSVPNRVTLVSQGSEDSVALTATATNTSADSKFSTVSRGRVISIRETGVEAASLAVLQGLAQRRLESLTTSVRNLSITTAPIPVWPNDRVDLVSPSRSSTVPATVSSWSLDLVPGGLMTHQWREVVTL